jgi:hypothetical protein
MLRVVFWGCYSPIDDFFSTSTGVALPPAGKKVVAEGVEGPGDENFLSGRGLDSARVDLESVCSRVEGRRHDFEVDTRGVKGRRVDFGIDRRGVEGRRVDFEVVDEGVRGGDRELEVA